MVGAQSENPPFIGAGVLAHNVQEIAYLCPVTTKGGLPPKLRPVNSTT
jgi:hypothetical protein